MRKKNIEKREKKVVTLFRLLLFSNIAVLSRGYVGNNLKGRLLPHPEVVYSAGFGSERVFFDV